MKRLTKYDKFGNAELIGIDNTKLYERLVCDETVALTIATNKLSELEDVLEKHDIESVEELDLILQGLKNIHQENANLKQELAELKQNAIVPKFKVGQEIWEITPLMSWKIKRIELHKFNGGNGDVVMEIYRLGHDGTDDYNCCIMPVDNDRFFATKEEAQAKLEELGEKDE